MPLEFRTGDLFAQKDINVIVHQANTRGTLFNRTSHGIASLIEKLYPEAADADVEPHDESKLGTYTTGVGHKDGRIICNCYSQRGQDTDYNLVLDILSKIEVRVAAYNQRNPESPKAVGAPYGYGSNIASGRWTIVEAIFRAVFLDSPVKCVIVRLPNQPELK